MAERNISDIKSSLLKAISDQLDSMERTGVTGARRADRDLYSRTGPGDSYSRTTPVSAFKTLVSEDPSFE